MDDLREQRDMRKAKRLMWLCVALALLALVMTWYSNMYMSAIRIIAVLPLLFSAIFFCLYQRGFRPKQLILLLPACAIVLYQLCINCRYYFSGANFDTLLIALSSLSKSALLLTLSVGLKKNDRRILRFGRNLMIATAIICAIYWYFDIGIQMYMRHTGNLVVEACELSIYALIAYRGVVADDITLPGYPMRIAKPAPAGSAASISATQGGQVIMGSKSKVATALLAFFLGTTGAHRYYLGYGKQGAIQTCGFVSLVIGWMLYVPAMVNGGAGTMLLSGLLLLFGSATSIWAFIDFIRILTGGLAPADGSGYAVQQVQVVQPAPAPAPAASSGFDDLEKLAKLRDSGVLTEEEFQRKKAEILERL